MPQFKFDEYLFNSQSYELRYRGEIVTLRPKTLQLLAVLIGNRHRLVSKQEIMQEVWGSKTIRDYLLFQLVSEIRKLPSKGNLVRTQPNEGYQWAVFTTIKTPINTMHKFAASFLLGMTCIALFSYVDISILDESSTDKGEVIPKQGLGLPANKAFSAGMIALENGNYDKAIEWFEFSLTENTESIELKLFLAEALYLDNQIEASLIQLHSVLKKSNLNAYNRMTATDLLSQIRQHQGRLNEALVYARYTEQFAVESVLSSKGKQFIGQCSSDMVRERIHLLERMLNVQTELANNPYDENNHPSTDTQRDIYKERCDEVNNKPIETSFCIPTIPRQVYAHKSYFLIHRLS